MPTNGFADGILYTVNGAPVFTYGMITLTAVVLAYVTFIEAPDVPIETNPIVGSIPQAPLIPQIPSITNPVASAPIAFSPVQPFPVPSSPVPSSPDQTSPVVSSPDQTSPVVSSPDERFPVTSSQVTSIEQKAQGGKKIKRRKTRRIR
jgi:hypothetical protein